MIAEGPQSEIDRIARQYGLQVVSRLDSGARLSGTGAQIDQAAGDGGADGARRGRARDRARWRSRRSPPARASSGAAAPRRTTASPARASTSSSSTRASRTTRIWTSASSRGSTTSIRRPRSASTLTATARTWRGSSRAAARAAAARTAAPTSAWRPATGLISIRVLGTDGSGLVSDVIKGIEWSVNNKDKFNIRVDQSLARSSRDVALQGRSAGEGRRARGRQRHRRHLLGRQSGQDRRRHADRRRHRLAGRHAGRADGGIAQHARHGRAERRWRHDVQLARTGRRSGSAVDVGAQAGRRCAGQCDCVGGSAGDVSLGQLPVTARTSARTAGPT